MDDDLWERCAIPLLLRRARGDDLLVANDLNSTLLQLDCVAAGCLLQYADARVLRQLWAAESARDLQVLLLSYDVFNAVQLLHMLGMESDLSLVVRRGLCGRDDIRFLVLDQNFDLLDWVFVGRRSTIRCQVALVVLLGALVHPLLLL